MNKFLLLLGTAGLLLTASCRNEDVVVCAPAVETTSLTSFSRRNMPAEQVFNLADISQNQTVRTFGGAVLTIPGNSLVVANTGAVATGAAQLRFREIYEVPDMIIANLCTQTSGTRTGLNPSSQVLESGGEFQIQIWQGQQRLVSQNGPVPTPVTLTSIRPPRTTRLYSQPRWWTQALLPPPTALSTPDTAGWRLSTSGVVRIDTSSLVPQTPARYVASFRLDSMSLHNCDWLWRNYPNLPLAALKIIIPPQLNQTPNFLNTRVYIVPAIGNVAFRPGFSTATNNWYLGNLTATLAYTAVVLQDNEGSGLRFATQRFTLASAGSELTISPTDMKEADILRLIRQL